MARATAIATVDLVARIVWKMFAENARQNRLFLIVQIFYLRMIFLHTVQWKRDSHVPNVWMIPIAMAAHVDGSFPKLIWCP